MCILVYGIEDVAKFWVVVVLGSLGGLCACIIRIIPNPDIDNQDPVPVCGDCGDRGGVTAYDGVMTFWGCPCGRGERERAALAAAAAEQATRDAQQRVADAEQAARDEAAATWKKGDYAYHNSKEAVVVSVLVLHISAKKYTDGDVTLRYADGTKSGYIRPSTLIRSNRSAFDESVIMALNRKQSRGGNTRAGGGGDAAAYERSDPEDSDSEVGDQQILQEDVSAVIIEEHCRTSFNMPAGNFSSSKHPPSFAPLPPLARSHQHDPSYEPTPEEIHEYAAVLGMDVDKDTDLLWIAREGLKVCRQYFRFPFSFIDS